jgi:DNA (cytosine-5)-methyltransferase 1
MSGLIVDLFAGGGGASTGIEWALGRSPDVAINHSADAIAMHEANHPNTRHLRGNVWDYAPLEVTGGRPVELLWASPTCTFFSKAKGGPLDRREASKVRSLATVVTRWARAARPRLIVVENVEAFAQWGPLTNAGKPCPFRKGKSFKRWISNLRGAGYHVEWRELRGCDYGAPTSRKRLFVVASLEGRVVFPAPTHGPKRTLLEQPYRTALECIDWSVPCPSIAGRAKPLSDATLRRVERGLQRFVLESPAPLIVDRKVPWMIHLSNGERVGQSPRIYDLRLPLGTIVAGGIKHGLVCAFLAKHYGGKGSPGADLRLPLSTITTVDHHALVTVHGEPVVDIGMRPLTPRELFRAQGFPDSYRIDMLSKTAQIRAVGNSVCPHVAAAVVRSNFQRMAVAA